MALYRDGRNASAYLGVRAATPPQFEKHPRAPTANDYRNFNVSTIWLDTSNLDLIPSVAPTSDDIYILVSKSNNVASWINFGDGNVNSVSGGTNINITGTATDPIVNLDGGTPNTVAVYSGTGSLSEVSSVGTNGQVLTANTGAAPTWQAATVGVVTSITGGTNINVTGTAAIPIVNLDAAISLATSVTSPLYTVASGDLVLNMADDAGTDSVSFTNDSDAEVASINSLGAATFTNLDVDNININGNTIISTDTNGDITLTPDGTGSVNIDYATPNTVAVYGTSGALSEVSSVGTNGQVLTANTGAAPTWQAATVGVVTSITGGTNINVTGTAAIPIVNLDAAISLATSVTSPLYTVASGDLVLNMADDAGTDSVSFTNDSDAEVASINSLGAATFTNLDVDNININGNTIISTDTNGDITLTPDGTGSVNIDYATPNTVAVYGTSGALSEVSSVGTNGQVLTANTGAAPTWQAASSGGGSSIMGKAFETLNTVGSIRYATVFEPSPSGSNEGAHQIPMSQSGTLDNFYVQLGNNSSTNDVDYTVRLDGVNTTLIVTTTALTFGQFSNTVDSVAVTEGELLSISIEAGVTGFQEGAFSMRFTAS